MKIRPLGAELFHADRHDEDNSRISQFLRTRLKMNGGIFVVFNAQ